MIGVDTPATFSLVNTAGAPAAIDALGAGAEQSTEVATAFDEPLVAKVADAFGNPVPGVAVTFAAPASGASATLSAGSATTDDNGLASVTATANALPGSYAATASTAGLETPTTFELSNVLPNGTTVDQAGGGTQSGEVNSAFRCALEVAVAKPDGSPYAGLQVRFDAPASGASATLSDGVDSGASLTVATDDWPEGSYLLLLTSDAGFGTYVPVTVRTGQTRGRTVLLNAVTTWQAYNQYGGNSLYVGSSGAAPDRAVKVSYNRPFTTRGTNPEDWIFNAEYPMIRWLEANGYDVSYFTGIDSDRFGAEMKNGAFVGQHGSWNRVPRSGYKVIFVPFADGKPSGRPATC